MNNLSRDEFIAYCMDKASESFLCRFLGNIKTDDLFFLVDIGELEDELIDRYDCMDLEERKEFVKEVQRKTLQKENNIAFTFGIILLRSYNNLAINSDRKEVLLW